MGTGGRLEAKITVPEGGWTVSLVGTSSGDATIPAGEYYLSSGVDEGNDLLAEIASQFSTVTGDTVSCTAELGEAGSGKVTLSSGGGTFEVTWDSGDGNTDLRDLLGFDADLAGQASYESPGAARGAWMPDSPFRSLNGGGSWGGWIESNAVSVVSPAGDVWTLYGQRMRVLHLEWEAVTRERIWDDNENVENQSLNQLYLDSILGEAPWAASPNGPFRWYPDAGVDGTYRTYKLLNPRDFRPERFSEDWVGCWRVQLELVEVPEGGTALVIEKLLLDAEWHTPTVQEFPDTAAGLDSVMSGS